MIPKTLNLSPACRYRNAVLCLGFMVGFAVIFGRLVFLQVIQAEEGADRARRQHQKLITLQADRGLIVDRNGKSLALNIDVPSLYAIPASIKSPADVARRLAPVVDIPSRTLTKQLSKDHHFVWVKRKVDPRRAKAVQSVSMSGVNVIMEVRRFYPKGMLLSNLLGFAGIDSQGLEGIELQYDSYLRGQQFVVQFQRDALGRTILPAESRKHRPSRGHRITLTIDEVIQFIAEHELDAAINRTGAQRGAVLIMDPSTGEILAWALRPTFDPNDLRHLSPDQWRNRAVTDPYEPGSTLKIVVAAAALEEDLVDPDTMIYGGEGEMPVAGTIVHDHAKSGWITFSEALAHSSNVGLIKTAIGLGEDRFYQYLRAFGFGEKTEIDLPGESSGILKEPTQWEPRTLASMAIGQEIAVTPLQLVTAMSAVANGGWLLKPYVVSDVRDVKGNSVMERKTEVKRRPISLSTAKTLTSLLEKAVEKGTGKRARTPGFSVAGKTGTAQKINRETGKYSASQFIGSFVGFVPSDQPRLAILVVIDEPQTDAWGGVVAAPVFRRIAEQVLRHMGIVPNHAQVISTVSANNPSAPVVMVH